MRLVYLGTPQMAVPPLRALVGAGHDVVRVITRADTRRGRGGAASPSPVKAAALELGLTVGHDTDEVADAVAAGAELGVVVAYGRIIKPHLLDLVPMVNLHFSLLPRWRGAAPVERAILAGDERTGVAVMRVEEGLDTGGIYAEAEVPIGPTTTASDLATELVDVGTGLLVEVVSRPVDEWIDDARPQSGEATYAAKLDPAEFEIDWSRPATEIDRVVRVGRAWTTFRGKRLKVLAARLEPAAEATDGAGAPDGADRADRADRADGVCERLVPILVQPEGKAPMDFAAWRNGARPTAGEPFGDLP